MQWLRCRQSVQLGHRRLVQRRRKQLAPSTPLPSPPQRGVLTMTGSSRVMDSVTCVASGVALEKEVR